MSAAKALDPTPPRVLVGTLSAGENELDRCIASLEAQDYRLWEHVVVRDLPNVEAHRSIYQTFMARSGEFGLFLKLDADMVLRSAETLRRVVNLFRCDRELDHAQMAVHDWFSDGPIMGLHVYRNRVRWPIAADETLFVDRYPAYPGRRLDLWIDPAPVADHCPDPAPDQAFCYGVHRALKVVQRHRAAYDFDAPQSCAQLQNLLRTFDHFQRVGDRRLGLAVLGAELVLNGELPQDRLDDKVQHGAVHDAFRRVAGLDPDAIRAQLGARWSTPRRWAARHRAWVLARATARKASRLWHFALAQGRRRAVSAETR